MPQYHWQNCPLAIQTQVNSLLEAIESLLGENLIGTYLHGSLAMACFNPDTSDIDLLVATQQGMPLGTKRDLAELLLQTSAAPSPIEISFLRRGDFTPWQYPTPFDLHYSEMWRERYQQDLQSDRWQHWNEQENYDEDLASHLTLLRHRGICLSGQPIVEVFPVVPPQDYLASILADLEWAKGQIGQNPVYLILNVCRVYGYVQLGRVYSKDEGGVWALTFIPQAYQPVVTEALERYRGQHQGQGMDQEQVSQFIGYMEQQLKACLPGLLKPKG
jgi:predicted nucleotidyltransferase